MKTFVYVDGFNLYYAIRRTPYKWLELAALCRRILPSHDIARIKYFTARVHPRPQDPGQGIRQASYLRALQTIPNLEIHEGHFVSHRKWSTLAPAEAEQTSLARMANDGTWEFLPVPEGANRAYVWRTDEKGSDVNLASHLLRDGFRHEYELAVVISNDSDLAGPIRMVRQELDVPVGVLNPHTRYPSGELHEVAAFQLPIWPRSLKACQFPSHLQDAIGTFHKPPEW